MKPLIVILFACFCLAVQSQTCIIIYVSSKGITAGADRKYHEVLISTDTKTAKQQKTFKVHYGKKIFSRNNCFWAMSGADYYDTIHAICSQACNPNLSLQKIISNIRKRLQTKQVKNAMHELLSNSDKVQKERFKGNLTEIAFFKFDSNAYKAYRITLFMPGIYNNDETLHFDTDSIVATRKTLGVFVLGHYGAFEKNMDPEKWVDPVTTIRMLIKKQSASTPEEVSAESDIISITKVKYEWIKNN
ncbi:MAG TPA: hypothetical protein VKI61_01740 [Chitinophagaceae bacterium]|nr:hypothetical protein [Chitinophagaceae bacterium]